MAGGIKETDPEKLAQHCESFMNGAKRLYDGERIKAVEGDMWFFELYHHLNDCAEALRILNTLPRTSHSAMEPGPMSEGFGKRLKNPWG